MKVTGGKKYMKIVFSAKCWCILFSTSYVTVIRKCNILIKVYCVSVLSLKRHEIALA